MDELVSNALIDALAEARGARREAEEAKRLAMEAMIEIRAMQKSTHRTVLLATDELAKHADGLKPGEYKDVLFEADDAEKMQEKLEANNWHGVDYQNDPMG